MLIVIVFSNANSNETAKQPEKIKLKSARTIEEDIALLSLEPQSHFVQKFFAFTRKTLDNYKKGSIAAHPEIGEEAEKQGLTRLG
jgi:AraC-like DNA-binding protein